MKKLLLSVVAGVVVASVAATAFAGQNLQANIAIDLRAKMMGVATGTCAGTQWPTYTSCSQITQSKNPWVAFDDILVVLYNYTGITAAEFGLTWSNCQSSSPGYYLYPVWTRCGDVDVWAQHCGSISEAVAWSACKTTFATVAIWAQSGAAPVPGRIHLGFGPSDNHTEAVADCNAQTDPLHTLHDGYLGGAVPVPPGPLDLAPCVLGPTATQNATWSGVKALYH